MGKRAAPEHVPDSIRKRKKVNGKVLPNNVHGDMSSSSDESSNDADCNGHANGNFLNHSSATDNSPKPEFHLSRDVVNGTILTDITQKKWRIGKPIGKGSFGEIFLASDNLTTPVTSENAKYVVKIEPHSNGPLFVEIHCLLNTAKNSEENPLPPGMPEYIASGSHVFRDTRYRFLILPRFDRDLHSLIKHRRVDQKSLLTIAVQIMDILQHIHDKGHCHSDIKAENLMISKCTYRKSQLQENINKMRNDDKHQEEDDAVGSDAEDGEEDEEEEDNEEEEVDSDAGDKYCTPVRKGKAKSLVQFSGSNPVRSCRRKAIGNSMYEEMVKSHYLRPSKRVSYSEFFNEDNSKGGTNSDEDYAMDDYIKRSVKVSAKSQVQCTPVKVVDHLIIENRIFLIDFGLASKFVDSNGVHRPFIMDQRRAHDGTLEFTSRDAHMGAHARRSDLECLGYNLIFWSQGFLPWKDHAAQQQHEKVHWMKEYLMADVREMLKQIYGKGVPKYLGDYMHYVGKLAYHDRPDYEKCKNIFKREYERLGYDSRKMRLNVEELVKNSVSVKEEIENNNMFEAKNIKSIMKNLGVIMPFRESNSSNRVSPKNLRSKSEKKSNKKKKKFSWTEILSQDPDQIARERAEKEFEREPSTETPLIRYTGKPTYAILEIQKRLKFKDRLDAVCNDESDNEEVHIEGYNKAMMEVLKKRQVSLLAEAEENMKKKQQSQNQTQHQTQVRHQQSSHANHLSNGANSRHNNSTNSSSKNKKSTTALRPRTKPGLRTVITPTKRGSDYSKAADEQRQRRTNRRLVKTNSGGDFTTTDESSCSSLNSVANSRSSRSKKSSTSSASSAAEKSSSAASASSSSCPSGLSDEESRDATVFSPKRTRHGNLRLKIVKNAANGNLNVSPIVDNDDEVVGARRRKRSIPKKRNNMAKDDVYSDYEDEVRIQKRNKKSARRG